MIRPATLDDLPALLALQRLAFESEAALYPEVAIPPMRQTLAELRAEFPAFVTLVAEQNGQLLGSVRGTVVNGSGEIGRLMVHPEARRQKLGRRLMQEIERELSTPSFSLFTGERSLNNLKLYAALGYRQSGQHRDGPVVMIELTKAATLTAPGHLPAHLCEVHP